MTETCERDPVADLYAVAKALDALAEKLDEGEPGTSISASTGPAADKPLL